MNTSKYFFQSFLVVVISTLSFLAFKTFLPKKIFSESKMTKNVTVDSLLLEAELRTAIDECQFIPHYQPKITLETGEITGFEALVRWQHPTRGLLMAIR